MRFSHFSFFIFLLTAFFTSCNEDYTPKDKGYPRIVLPPHGYQPYTGDAPFTFEYAKCATINPDTLFFGEKPENPYWFNVYYAAYNARIHISYKRMNHSNNTFDNLLEDAYKLSFKHSVKAESIDRANVNPAPRVGGQLFTVDGNAASNYQFFLTDSTNHFVRGALYFYCPPNADSLAPVSQFIYKDIQHLIATFRWK